jgi:hypothetical protein
MVGVPAEVEVITKLSIAIFGLLPVVPFVEPLK